MQDTRNYEINQVSEKLNQNNHLVNNLEVQERQALDQLQKTIRTEKAYFSKFEKGIDEGMKKTMLSSNNALKK